MVKARRRKKATQNRRVRRKRNWALDILMDGLPSDEESTWDSIDELPEWIIVPPNET
jgi:hypothetical protein